MQRLIQRTQRPIRETLPLNSIDVLVLHRLNCRNIWLQSTFLSAFKKEVQTLYRRSIEVVYTLSFQICLFFAVYDAIVERFP